MKNNKFLKMKNLVLVLSLLLISLSSCDTEWIDSDLNIDPNSPADVPMELILPAAQQSMGFVLVGNDNARITNMWTQHFDGVLRQSFTTTRYQYIPADTDVIWSSTYTSILMNLHTLVEKSKEEGRESPYFRGVAQVMQATTLGITTDLFGDIPFSKAFGAGQGNYKPEYDTQEQIYDTIFNILDDAIVNLNAAVSVLPISGDVIYGGDRSKWTKAAYSIQARHYLQTSNKKGNDAYTNALAVVEKGFASNADDYLVPFEDANRNPISQFSVKRNDIRMGSTFVNMLVDNEDPRLPFYVAEDGNGEFVGSDSGSENSNASYPGTYAASETSSTVMMTFAELKFIEAEAHLMMTSGNIVLAQEAYEEAVAASVLRVTGEANTEWLEANINGVPVTLENIIKQKYIDGFATNQPYADYRRTGFPNLELAAGAVISQIPTRFPYPQSELDYNTSNVPSANQLTDKVWWDQ
jgi:hypothetical protein